MIPKAVWLIKTNAPCGCLVQKSHVWLDVSAVWRCTGTLNWNIHTTLNIFSTAGTEHAAKQRCSNWNVKVYFWKNRFVPEWPGWMRLSREAINHKLRWEGEKKQKPCLFWWVQKQLADNLLRRYISSVHLLPSLFLSFLLLCFFLFSAQQKKGDLDRLKAWRSVSLQSS